MLAKFIVKENLLEGIAKKIALRLQQTNDVSEIGYLKMKLGIEALLINITKGIVVYGLAIILNNLLPTLILHSAYLTVRRVSFGLHAQSSTNCTLISVIMFTTIPYFMRGVTISNEVVLFLFLIYIICLYCFAPADTEKCPLIGEKRREKLRNQSVLICIGLMILSLVVPVPMVKTLVTTGVAVQVLMILPITYKILKRSCNNYESYEAESR